MSECESCKKALEIINKLEGDLEKVASAFTVLRPWLVAAGQRQWVGDFDELVTRCGFEVPAHIEISYPRKHESV